jgi:two-component sensor histidine kinase
VSPLVPVTGTHLRIVHSDGTVLVAQRMRANGDGLETVTTDRDAHRAFPAPDFIVARASMEKSDLFAEVAVPRDAALARWDDRTVWITSGAALGLLTLSIFGYFGHRSLRREEAAMQALEARTEELHCAVEVEKLLRAELQHRVKNSLALAAGMLHFEKAQARDSEMRTTLDRVQARIMAIGKVHDRLYDGDSPSAVSLDTYLWGLCDDVATNAGVQHAVDAEPIVVLSTQAVSIGLIVTELLLNAAKHAGTGSATRVEVGARTAGDGLVLTIRDYGRGLPAGFDASGSHGLGMRIVSSLLAQLNGRIEAENANPGTRFTVRIPLDPEREDDDPSMAMRAAV